jgi:hypothetical protein
LGLHGRKVLPIHCALLIWEEVERISRIWASTEFTGEVVSTSLWMAKLFKGVVVQLTIYGRRLLRLCMVSRKEEAQ